MGLRLLHNLWDETLAGPPPETGLGNLVKHKPFSSVAATQLHPAAPRDDQSPVSRGIAIFQKDARRHRNLGVDIDSSPVDLSPSGSSAPSSPFSPISPGENLKRTARRRSTTTVPCDGSRSWRNSDYDWIVLSALER